MEYSAKIDHDNVPISHGNTTMDLTSKYNHKLFLCIRK